MDKPNGHFDKLLLSFFVLFFAIGASFLSERFKDTNLAVAMMDNVKLFVGALLGFITGRAVQRATDPGPTANVTETTTRTVETPANAGDH